MNKIIVLLTKWGWWEESTVIPTAAQPDMVNDLPNQVIVDAAWYAKAARHYCGVCERWFADTRGLSMHNRHQHKDSA